MSAAKKGERGAGSGPGGKRIGRRLVIFAAIVGVVWYAVQGGEYSTFALFSQKSRTANLQKEVDAMQRQVDSLSRWKRAVQTDPIVQERIAREEFGMVRGNKELLYRFVDGAEAKK